MTRHHRFGFLTLLTAVLIVGGIARGSLVGHNARVMLCAARLAQLAQETVYYVKADATGTPHNGLTWDQAFTDLPTAVLNAGNIVDQNDELWVAAVPNVSYKPTSGMDRTLSIPMKTRVEIYGGFVGTESLRSQRDWVANETILSGDIGVPSVVTDNSYHVVIAAGVAASAVLDGFTIKDGFANGGSDPTRTGAGLRISGLGSSPRILRCTITGNSAPSGGGHGAGVWSSNTRAVARFEDCVISNNGAYTRGGGAYIFNSQGTIVLNCEFSNNSTTNAGDIGGGALLVGTTDTQEITLTGCTFQGNTTTAGSGGAIYHQDGSSFLDARGCAFDSNTANNGQGGALYATSGCRNTLVYCLFYRNKSIQAGEAFAGGAIALAGASGEQNIINSQFFENEAVAQGYGGALFTVKNASGVFVTNCLFAGNKAKFGAAAYCKGEDFQPVEFRNATVADNIAGTQASPGHVGGIDMEGTSQVVVHNSILWNNKDWSTNSTSYQQIRQEANQSLPVVTYSCVQGDFTGSGGTANIDDPPLFVDDASANVIDRNYRLKRCSLASDAADFEAVAPDIADLNNNMITTAEAIPYDLDGVDRTFDGAREPDAGNGTPPFTDMGAYEDNSAVCVELGDLNGDTLVDGLDIDPFMDCLLSSSTTCPCADFSLNGVADLDDRDCFVALLVAEETCGIVCAGGQRSFSDCQGNGIPDVNDIGGASEDCNANGIPDECEIEEDSLALGGPWYCTEGCAADVNVNGVPDECEPDCNGNGVPDAWDIVPGLHPDLNANGVPDECEPDCNANDVPDELDVLLHTSADCNGDGEPDECTADCNGNGQPDDCDVDPSDPDHNLQTSPDCNDNDWPDECDLAQPPGFGSLDCNANAIPDECDMAVCAGDPACGDCNENGIMDSCDIAAAVSEDANTNGIPDECEGEGMMGGESYSGDETDWEAFHEWAVGQCWGPGCADNGAAQFQQLVDKLEELSLPVQWPPTGP